MSWIRWFDGSFKGLIAERRIFCFNLAKVLNKIIWEM